MNGPWVEATALEKRFGSTCALDGVSWRGGAEVVGVVGPNGAGKSTFLQVLATVLAPDGGAVRIDGFDAARPGDRLAVRRMLGYLPQRDQLYRSFTVWDLVEYVAVLKEQRGAKARRDEVARVLSLVGLERQRHRRIRQLSVGTCRRVSLAAALIGTPALLVLDEPCAGLDPDERLRLYGLLGDSMSSSTVVVSGHDVEELAARCRRLLVLAEGRVVFDGAPAALAAVARDRVWLDDRAHPDAVRSWPAGGALVRSLGDPPDGAQLVQPSPVDGYLLLTNGSGR